MNRLIIFCSALLIFFGLSAAGQQQPRRFANPPGQKAATAIDTTIKSAPETTLPANLAVATQHNVTVKGVKFGYTATAGTQPVYDKDGRIIASMFYVYYERNDVKDKANRPLLISFNGGPGTGSVWMNIGFTGPRLLNIDDEGYPVQPYGVRENPYSVLDEADILFVDPVNTGFSRILDKKTPTSVFFGVNADITYLAEWINTFLSRSGRWESPKFLIGESYGTTRVSGLALALQNQQWIYLNGVILVSPTDLGLPKEGPMKEASMLPYYAATAWYHKALSPDLQQKDLVEMLPEVENFTINEYLPALAMGGNLDPEKRTRIIEKVSHYSGINKTAVTRNNLIIAPSFFWKELLRDKGFTVGRLDSRYLGVDFKDAGTSPDYNPELTSWLQSFTPAINAYLRKDLGVKTDLKYFMFGPVHPWDNSNNHTGMDLSKAMLSNPGLHLMVLSGYYDGACDYFNAKYNMWQINQNGKLGGRMEWHGYRSGHMMYLRSEDLRAANQVLRDFIKKSIPAKDAPIKY